LADIAAHAFYSPFIEAWALWNGSLHPDLTIPFGLCHVGFLSGAQSCAAGAENSAPAPKKRNWINRDNPASAENSGPLRKIAHLMGKASIDALPSPWGASAARAVFRPAAGHKKSPGARPRAHQRRPLHAKLCCLYLLKYIQL
jgi:hypothetical protein